MKMKPNTSVVQNAYALLQEIERLDDRFLKKLGMEIRDVETSIHGAERAYRSVEKKLQLDDQRNAHAIDEILTEFLSED